MKTNAHRMETLSAHYFATLGPRIAALRASGCDVIRLDEGSPDLPPAPPIIDALARSAASPQNHSYQLHKGIPILQEAWAEMYQRVFGVDLDPESEVLPLLGSKEGIFHLLLALVEPGDFVIVPDPGYITYSRGTLFAGGEPYFMPLIPGKGYLPDLKAIPEDVARKAKLLWLNYPNNPTAAMATVDFFAEALTFAREHDLLVCHDAAYAQVTFDGVHAPSILEIPGAKETAVEFNTLSKSHNMAGWRVGVAVGSPVVLQALYTLKSNADSSHFRPIMDAAVEAMTGDQGWLKERNSIYQARRDLVVTALHQMGFQADLPKASLYVWFKLPEGWYSEEFVQALLEKTSVSLTPGTLFGKQGEGYVRISLTAPTERVAMAMQRMAAALPVMADRIKP
jgi:LL-diaminopimelate aminotransferase